jgi:hypothetical protein
MGYNYTFKELLERSERVAWRIEDLIVIDPFDSVHSYNFVLTGQRADVKALLN